jgi:LPS-assembly lipoprotein
MNRRLGFARLAALVVVGATLPACGFHLRGQADLPFNTVAVPNRSPLGVDIARNITYRSGTKVVDSTTDAEAVLNIIGESRERVILSLNTQGQVQEYTLRYRLIYSVSDPKGAPLIPPSEIVLRRDITFNNQVLAKEQEAELLYRDMRNDAVQQVLNRLAAAKLRPAEALDPRDTEPSLFE